MNIKLNAIKKLLLEEVEKLQRTDIKASRRLLFIYKELDKELHILIKE